MRDRTAVRLRQVLAAFVAVTLLAACLPSTTLVRGDLVGGGRAADLPHDVQFVQAGRVVATAKTGLGQTFQVRLPPGTYTLVAPNFPGGCPPQAVTVGGSEIDLHIFCNLMG
jgi:hypothetical protein